MITFLSAVYNEEEELSDLLESVEKYVERYAICDDGSTDRTLEILGIWHQYTKYPTFNFLTIDHTGSCELARIKALELVSEDSWVLMLDADERIPDEELQVLAAWVRSEASKDYTHVYFNQMEFIDGQQTRAFTKVKLFKKESAHLPEIIHGDPWFDGQHLSSNWHVIHRKTSAKQVQREKEYLVTYQKLLDEGKIDQGKYEWFRNLHYYIKEVPHG